MPSRRHVLTAAALWATSGLAAPALAIGDLELNLVRRRTGEAFKGPLTRQGLLGSHLDKDVLGKLNTLMRDVRAKKAIEMDIDLIELVGRIQRNVGSKPIVITSAYRTASTNAALRGSAKKSFHMRGQALDIRVSGLSTNRLARLARSEGAGGVGRYSSRGFVHIDTGPRRDWRR